VAAIHEAYPDLSLAQIHAALSHYYAHQDEMDGQIEREEEETRALLEQHTNPVTREELQERIERG
jgi:hypothetical protein